LAAIAVLATPAIPASAADASADLATTVGPTSGRMLGGPVTFTITVKNNGPDSAQNVVLSDTFSGFATFQSVSAPSGTSCTAPPFGTRGTVTCTTGSLAPGDSVTVRVTVHAGNLGFRDIIGDTATATSTTFDPNTANNSAAGSLMIVP
jgi:uncharacterized repeat protein (TIGR01451 family)